jgi:anti-anti-sigma factor
MADLKITVEDIPGVEGGKYVVIQGEIGPSGAPHFASRLEDLFKDHVTSLLLDLTEVSYMNSSALATLIKLEDRLESGYLGLVGVQSNAKIVMDNLGIGGLFHTHPTRDKAIEAVMESTGTTQAVDAVEVEAAKVEEEIVADTRAQHLFHPTLSLVGEARPGARLILSLGLRRKSPDPGVISGGIKLKDLAPGWTEQVIEVKLESSDVRFDPGGDQGVIMIKHDAEDAGSCTLIGTVSDEAAPGGKITVEARFSTDKKPVGSAYREFSVAEKN